MLISFWSAQSNENENHFLVQGPLSFSGIENNFPLKQIFIQSKNQNIEIKHFRDIEKLRNVDLFIFFDLNKVGKKILLKIKKLQIPKYLFIRESKTIIPYTWQYKNHEYFDKIFTWNDNFVDNVKYFKLFEPNKNTVVKNNLNKKNLCVVIASNKYAYESNELYSARFRTIKWFEDNHPNNLDLYGLGWDINLFSHNFILKPLNKFQNYNLYKKIFRRNLKVYKGYVKDKIECLSSYKFSICYENAIWPGYVTEKIFDCFYAGTVPIYLGAPNITRYIDKKCFIDRRDFNSDKSLYEFIINLSNQKYSEYLKNAQQFLNTETNGLFSPDYCIKNMLKIFNSLNNL